MSLMNTIQRLLAGRLATLALAALVLLALALGFLAELPVPAAEFAVLAAAGVAWLRGLPAGRSPARGTNGFLWLACAWALLGLTDSSSTAGIRDCVQPALALLVAVAAGRNLPDEVRPALGRVLLLGWFATALFALGQAVAGTAVTALGGGFGNRALYGSVMAVLAVPALASGLRLLDRTAARSALVAVCLGLGMATIAFLPALALFSVCTLAWLLVKTARPVRLAAVATVAVFALALLWSPDSVSSQRRAALRQSVATHDAGGLPRRWTLEARAARRAIADRPWLGHGPASYQRVVSGAKYRADLPMTAENRVEPGTQSAVLVSSVQFGIPFAALLVLGLASAAFHGIRQTVAAGTSGEGGITGGPSSVGDCASPANPRPAAADLGFDTGASGWACGATVVVLLFSTPLVLGAEVLLGLMVGGAMRNAPPKGGGTRVSRLSVQCAAIVCVGVGAVLFGRLAPETASAAPPPDAPGLPPENEAAAITLEAENALKTGACFVATELRDARGGAGLRVAEVGKERMAADPGAQFGFFLPRSGSYRVWVLAKWADGCSNSVAVQIGEQAPVLVGNDGTYRVWHWVASPVFELAKGRHTLRLLPREANAEIDAVRISLEEGGAMPPAVATPTDTGEGEVADRKETLPFADAEQRSKHERFLAAVGGSYQNGPEAILFEMGIPYERLRMDEVVHADALSRYDLVWISGARSSHAHAWEALEEYVRKGGTAIAELMPEVSPHHPWAEKTAKLAPFFVGNEGVLASRVAYWGRASVHAQDSPWFTDEVPKRMPLFKDILFFAAGDVPPEQGTSHGRISFLNRDFGPVGVVRSHGEGRFTFLAVPMGFISMWRGTRFDPVARNVVREALGDRYDPLYTDFSPPEQAVDGLVQADDFMRGRGDPDQWTVREGTLRLAGGPNEVRAAMSQGAPEDTPFTLVADAPALAERPVRSDVPVRLGVSVRTPDGEVGCGLALANGAVVRILYDAHTQRLRLVRRQDETVEVLQETLAPGPSHGWRRLSLMRRDGQWEGWLDHRRLLRTAGTDSEAPARALQLVQLRGAGQFDDVAAVRVAALPEGTDRAFGEEGSQWAHPQQEAGVEPRTIYSTRWYLRPDPLGRNAVVSEMPCYGPATASVGGKPLGRIRTGQTEPLIHLPKAPARRHPLRIDTAYWRDYAFQGQLVDWYSTGSPWSRRSRWACDRKWEWLGTKSRAEPAILWHRQPLAPPYTLSVLCAPVSRETRSRYSHGERGNDLNLVVAGNGRDVTEGYICRTGRIGRNGLSVKRDGRTLGQEREVGLPPSFGLALHHRWLWLHVRVETDRIVLSYEGREALTVELDEPPQPGFVGFWTVHNEVQIARATLSVSPVESTQEAPPDGPDARP